MENNPHIKEFLQQYNDLKDRIEFIKEFKRLNQYQDDLLYRAEEFLEATYLCFIEDCIPCEQFIEKGNKILNNLEDILNHDKKRI